MLPLIRTAIRRACRLCVCHVGRHHLGANALRLQRRPTDLHRAKQIHLYPSSGESRPALCPALVLLASRSRSALALLLILVDRVQYPRKLVLQQFHPGPELQLRFGHLHPFPIH